MIISLIIIIVSCIPIFFVGKSHVYGFLTALNCYVLSPFSLPTLILMPFVHKNKKLFFWYILLFPLGWNIFFIFYFFGGELYNYISIVSFIVGILTSLFLMDYNSKFKTK